MKIGTGLCVQLLRRNGIWVRYRRTRVLAACKEARNFASKAKCQGLLRHHLEWLVTCGRARTGYVRLFDYAKEPL
jgi:hypothetical protein